MERWYCIGLDAHSGETEVAVLTPAGRVRDRQRVATSVTKLREVVAAVPRPRQVVLEESTIADWLWRNLRDLAEDVVVCDPRLQGRGYGRVFVASLPPMSLVTELPPVLALLRELEADIGAASAATAAESPALPESADRSKHRALSGGRPHGRLGASGRA